MRTSQLHTRSFIQTCTCNAKSRGKPKASVKRKGRNPLKGDPSRTATLRRKFLADLNGRFNILKKRLRELVVTEDAFGIDRQRQLTKNTRFMFNTTPQKVEAFRRWLKLQMQQLLVGEHERTQQDWWEKYIQEGYAKGAGRAFEDTNGGKNYAQGYSEDESTRDFYKGTKAEFLRSSFAQPVAVEKVKLLAGRVYTDLEGITQSMSTKLVRTLTDGLVQGKSPREIARDIDEDVDGIDRSRALTIARTEIIRTHAEGQLDAFENLGVTEVGVAAEWSTAEDEKVCEECAPLEGVVMAIEEARGLLPRHPNCRCAWVPANVGEDEKEQVRSKRDVEDAIDESIEAEIPDSKEDRTLDQQKKITSWPGADTEIDDERPESTVLNLQQPGPFAYAGFNWWGHTLLDNVFCPTGPGGGVDPTCEVGLAWAKGGLEEYLKSHERTTITGKLAKEGTWVKLPSSFKVIENPEGEFPNVDFSKFSNAPIQKLPIKDLTLVQPIAKVSHLEGKNPPNLVFDVMKSGDTYILWDGTHRLVKEAFNGETKIQARVVEYKDLISNQTLLDNVFYATGPGGGVDATCSPGGESEGKSDKMGLPKELSSVLSPDEQKEYNRLISDRTKFNKLLKETTDPETQRQLKEGLDHIQTRRAELLALAKSRGGVEPKRTKETKVSETETTTETKTGTTTGERAPAPTTGTVRERVVADTHLVDVHSKIEALASHPDRTKASQEVESATQASDRMYENYQAGLTNYRLEASKHPNDTGPLYRSDTEMALDFAHSKEGVILLRAKEEAITARREAEAKQAMVEERLRMEAFKLLQVSDPVKVGIEFQNKNRIVAEWVKQKNGKGKAVQTLGSVPLETQLLSEQVVSWLSNTVAQRTTGTGELSSIGFKVHAIPQNCNGGRSFHRDGAGAFLTKCDVRTVAHEFGHELEEKLGAYPIMKKFVADRVAESGKPWVKLAEQFPDHKFEAGETGNQEGWNKLYNVKELIDSYSGSGPSKVYGSVASAYYVSKDYGNAGEALSMGLEALYQQPLHFAKADPEYFKVVVGVLHNRFEGYK